MSKFIKSSDLAISSQGRTMFELASLGVPTILIAQNERELHHEFGDLENGFINLGLGTKVDKKTIYETLNLLINSVSIRKQMHQRMIEIDFTSGVKNCLKIILDVR
jgi:spore coat polysaccharide biosynthesis predicted glycosyltransferase SpsG